MEKMLNKEEVAALIRKHSTEKLFLQVLHGVQPTRRLRLKRTGKSLGKVSYRIYYWYSKRHYNHPSESERITTWELKPLSDAAQTT